MQLVSLRMIYVIPDNLTPPTPITIHIIPTKRYTGTVSSWRSTIAMLYGSHSCLFCILLEGSTVTFTYRYTYTFGTYSSVPFSNGRFMAPGLSRNLACCAVGHYNSMQKRSARTNVQLYILYYTCRAWINVYMHIVEMGAVVDDIPA